MRRSLYSSMKKQYIKNSLWQIVEDSVALVQKISNSTKPILIIKCTERIRYVTKHIRKKTAVDSPSGPKKTNHRATAIHLSKIESPRMVSMRRGGQRKRRERRALKQHQCPLSDWEMMPSPPLQLLPPQALSS